MRQMDDVFLEPWDKRFPKAVQIETSSSCNSRCVYCPYPLMAHSFSQTSMSDTLFEKILEELIAFQPLFIAPYMNNEPLTDRKIFSRLHLIREGLPRAYIDFSTNAGLLDEKSALALATSGVDEIKINFPSTIKEEYESLTGMDFDNNLRNVVQLAKIVAESKYSGLLRVIMVGSEHPERDASFWEDRGIQSKMYRKISRGGSIHTSFMGNPKVTGCIYNRQNEWIHILSDGIVVLCCMDWEKRVVLGGVMTDTIYAIWNSARYAEVREKIKQSSDIEFICNKCEWSLYEKS